jgi:hypothetical protein
MIPTKFEERRKNDFVEKRGHSMTFFPLRPIYALDEQGELEVSRTL